MQEKIDLKYDLSSCAGPFDPNEAQAFQDWLYRSYYTNIVFDKSYLDHLRVFHGCVPGKRYFVTRTGTKHVVVRFLNFLSSQSTSPLARYAVEETWSALSDRLGTSLMPFAELFGGDMLCFDYERPGRPQIVVWFHEQSLPGKPHTEIVAPSFVEFLSLLKEKTETEKGTA